jgi:hypothetical protein
MKFRKLNLNSKQRRWDRRMEKKHGLNIMLDQMVNEGVKAWFEAYGALRWISRME